ncbi:hypothetical protein MRX96_050294 [Rhipicephalus microplus]
MAEPQQIEVRLGEKPISAPHVASIGDTISPHGHGNVNGPLALRVQLAPDCGAEWDYSRGSRTQLCSSSTLARSLRCDPQLLEHALGRTQLALIPGRAEDSNVTAVGRFGKYYGTVSMVHGVAVGTFLGVPYADPRTLRFGAPVPWYLEQEQFDTRSPAPSCAQASPRLDEMNASTSEDCLHLNIWAPACGSRPCSGNRTVVVFIHGGFFQARPGFKNQTIMNPEITSLILLRVESPVSIL